MAVEIPFVREMAFAYGEAEPVSRLVRRVVARNPSLFTLYGTNTYLVGRGRVAVIDPGPALDEHLGALLQALRGETVTHILVTHTHCDHSPAARALAAATGAVITGAGPHGVGAEPSGPATEEGIDTAFAPDLALHHREVVSGPGWEIEAVATPGHTSNHLCYALAAERALFTGDHVMAWSTSVVVPPDGDMVSYMASLRLLLGRRDATYWPGHGPPLREPEAFVEAYLAHRLEREAQILAGLAEGRARIADLVPAIYTEVDQRLHPAAAMSVLAHLRALVAAERVLCEGEPGIDSVYRPGPRLAPV